MGRNKCIQSIAVLMSVLMVSSSIDFGVLAQEDVSKGTIIAFKELPSEIASQTVPVGGSEADIVLPGELTVTLQKQETVEKQVPATVEADENEKAVFGPIIDPTPAPIIENILEESEEQEEEAELNTNEESDPSDMVDTEELEQPIEEPASNETIPDGDESVEVESESGELSESVNQSEPTAHEENENNEVVDTGFINLLFPAIVAHAEELETDEAQLESVQEEEPPEEEADDSAVYETVQTTETVTKEVTLSGITWKIDAEKSSGATFDSSVLGAKYIYLPTMPEGYGISAALPTIEVVIGEKSDVAAMAQSVVVDGVRIKLEADAGVFPEGATLTARKVEAVEAELVEAAVDEVRPEERNLVSAFTFDIKLLDANGNEIQPDTSKGKVKVSFELEAVANENLDTEVYHTDHGMNVEKLDSKTVDDTTVQAETDGFSYYTVEFTYGDLQYVMQGDSEIPLKDILDYVGLTGTVSNAYASNDELFSVEEKDGQWVVIALKAFQSEEWLKVTIDEVEYEIKVTDDITITSGDFGTDNSLHWEYDTSTKILTISLKEGVLEGGIPDRDTYRSNKRSYVDVAPWGDDIETVMESVVICDGITSIGNYTFRRKGTIISGVTDGLTNIKSVRLPSDLKTINIRAFAGTGIESLIIPKTVTSFGSYCFSGCTSLRSITINCKLDTMSNFVFNDSGCEEGFVANFGEEVEKIPNNIFSSNTKLKEVHLPSTITTIGEKAFDGCSLLDTVNGLENITNLGSYCFRKSKLNDVHFPKVNTIAESAFEGCDMLETVVFENTETIGRHAFYGCTSLKTVSIDNAKSVGYDSFNGCTSLENIRFENAVTVNASAFQGCSNLKSVYLPNVEYIGLSCFENDTKLEDVTLSNKLSFMGADNNVLLDIAPLLDGYELSIDHYAGKSSDDYKGQLYEASLTGNIGNNSVYYAWSDTDGTNYGKYTYTLEVPTIANLLNPNNNNRDMTGYKYGAMHVLNTYNYLKCTCWHVNNEGKIEKYAQKTIPLKDISELPGELYSTINDLSVVMFKGEEGETVKNLLARAGLMHVTCNNIHVEDVTQDSSTQAVVTITGSGADAHIKPEIAGETTINFNVYSKGCDYHGTQGNAEAPIPVSFNVYVLGASTSAISYDRFTLDLTGLPEGNTTCTIGNQTLTATQDNPSVTFTGLSPNRAYNVIIKLPDGSKSLLTNGLTASINTTTAKKPVGLTWENTTLTYNGAEQAPTVTVIGLVSPDTCTATVTGGATDVGDYTATATALSNSNYILPDENTKAFSITKRAVTIKADDQTVELNSSISQTVQDIQATGLLDGHRVNAVTITGSGTSSTTTSGTITPSLATIFDADSHDVTANYDITYQTGTLTVTKIKPTLTTPPTAISPLTYNGGNQAVVTAGVADGGTVYYSIDGTNWSSTVPEVKNAGEYQVRYYVVGDANHENLGTTSAPLGTVNVTIAKKSVIVSGISANDKIYDGNTDATADTSLAVFTGICSGDSLTVSATATFADADVGENKVVNLSGLTLGGTDVANYQLAATGNQTETTATILARSLASGVIVFEREEIERTGSTITPTIKFVKLGDLQLQIGADFVIDNESDTSGNDYGTYTLAVIGTGNYSGTTSHIWKITKTKPQVDEPITATITYGQNVGEGVLSGSMKHGDTPVPGTLSWVPDFEETAILDVGDHDPYYQCVVFTPDDTNSYATIHLDVQVVVNPKKLQVKADNKEKIAGMPNPELTYTATGFVHTDTAESELSGALVCLADETTLGGQTVEITKGTLATNSNNYTIAFTNGVLTITVPDIIVNTIQYSDLEKDSVTIYGAISPEKYGTATFVDKVGFEYKASGAENFTTVEKSVSASFSEALADLTPDTDYEYRAFIILKDETERVYGDIIKFHTLEEDVVEEATGSISVKVGREDPSDETETREVIVSVEHGNDLVVSKNLGPLTSSGLICEFEHIPDGNYNVVCRTADNKFVETKLLSVVNGEAVEAEFVILKGKLATVVEVQTADTPKVAVDGLEEILEESDKEDAANGKKDVEVKLSVAKKEEEPTDEISSIKGQLGEREKIDVLLDITLWKTIKDLDSMGNVTNVDEKNYGLDNTVVLQIAIPYSNIGKKGIAMFRYHGNNATRLTKISKPDGVGPDGTFYVDVSGGYIFLYAMGFSTYAIGYEEEETAEEENTKPDEKQPEKQSGQSGGDSSGGSGSSAYGLIKTTLVQQPEDATLEVQPVVEEIIDQPGKPSKVTKAIKTALAEEDAEVEDDTDGTEVVDTADADGAVDTNSAETADSDDSTDGNTAVEAEETTCHMHWLILLLAIIGVAISLAYKKNTKVRNTADGIDAALMAVLAIAGSCAWDWIILVAGIAAMAAVAFTSEKE